MTRLGILEAARLAAVLGLDLKLTLYRANDGIRDEAHAQHLALVLARVAKPLWYRVEVPLPRTDTHTELRSWDASLFGRGTVTRIEAEMRIRDAQALERRLSLKLRDDPSDHLLLVLADTHNNRRVLREHPEYFHDLPRLRPSTVFRCVERGEHPPTGYILVGAWRHRKSSSKASSAAAPP